MLALLVFLEKHAHEARDAAGLVPFYERLEPEEAAVVERLWRAVDASAGGDEQEAVSQAQSLLSPVEGGGDPLGARTARTFAEALLVRAGHSTVGGGNLYLDARPRGAQLRAFELLRLRTPLIPFAYAAANKALIDRIGAEEEVTLVDVGIGRGAQIRSLLGNPLLRRHVRVLHVIGIEPDSATSATAASGALEVAARQTVQAGGKAGIETTFHAVGKRAEDLTLDDILAGEPRGLVLGNANLALHHVMGREGAWAEGRRRVLRLLHEAGLEAVVLVEPDSNHDTDDLRVRFVHAFRHYRSVFRALESQLSVENADLVWREFFAPEVRNVLAHEEARRTERHEESAQWLEHLEHAGWRPTALEALLPQAAAPEGFIVREQGPAFSLRFQNVSLLSVMAAER